MSLAALLAKDRVTLLARWADAADAAYPFAAPGFSRTQAGAFTNPVGSRTRVAGDLLLSAVLDDDLDETVIRAAIQEGLEAFIRVRAVQEMTPEVAVGPLFTLKHLIRQHLAEQKFSMDDAARAELTALEDRIDTLALLAFSIYTRCRDDLHELRLNDTKRRHSQILRYMQRAGMTPEQNG